MARPIAEEIIGEELFLATYSFGRLSASCDGLTMDDHPPLTPGEDFSEFLAARPGAYVWLGTGDPAHPEGFHHNPHFDFNDAALAHGAAFWCSLVEQELA